MRVFDFDKGKFLPNIGYLGNAGRKEAYALDGDVWMVKYPQNTKDLQGKNIPSYTSSPLSEYLGSHIYESLGIATHETVLGKCQGKIVVGCKDFNLNHNLLVFHQIKNTVDDALISGSFGSSARGERLSDVLKVIDTAKVFNDIKEKVKMHFWDMFVVDAFIINNDRNNGNWGLMTTEYTAKIAPVYDNGNAFFNKRRPSVSERRLEDEQLIVQDALQGLSFFTDDNDNHINPYKFIASMQNKDCNAAVLRFAERVDFQKIDNIIEKIPTEIHDLPVISPAQKELYKQILHTGYEKGILPVVKKLKNDMQPKFNPKVHGCALKENDCKKELMFDK